MKRAWVHQLQCTVLLFAAQIVTLRPAFPPVLWVVHASLLCCTRSLLCTMFNVYLSLWFCCLSGPRCEGGWAAEHPELFVNNARGTWERLLLLLLLLVTLFCVLVCHFVTITFKIPFHIQSRYCRNCFFPAILNCKQGGLIFLVAGVLSTLLLLRCLPRIQVCRIHRLQLQGTCLTF